MCVCVGGGGGGSCRSEMNFVLFIFRAYFCINSLATMNMLEEICFLHVMKTLEQYTTDTLALLPVKFRERLLLHLPLVDVCRLEESAKFTAGLDMDALWEQLLGDYTSQCYSLSSPDKHEPSSRERFFKWLSSLVLRNDRPYKYATTDVSEWYLDMINFLAAIKLPVNDNPETNEAFKYRKVVKYYKTYHEACRARQLIPPRYASLFPEGSCCLPDTTALRLIRAECRFHCKKASIFIEEIKKLYCNAKQEDHSVNSVISEFFKDLEYLIISGEWEKKQTLIPNREDFSFKFLKLLFDYPSPKITYLSIGRVNASLLDSLCTVLASYTGLKKLSIGWDGKLLLNLQKMIPVTECQLSLCSVSMNSVEIAAPSLESSQFCSWIRVCLKGSSLQRLGFDFYTVPSEVLHELLMIFFTTPCSQEQLLVFDLHGQQKILPTSKEESSSSDSSASVLPIVERACVPWLKSVMFTWFKAESFFMDCLNALGSLKLKKLTLQQCSSTFFSQIVLHPCFEVEELKILYMSMKSNSFSEYDCLLRKASLKSVVIYHCLTSSEASGLLEAAELHGFGVEETPIGYNPIVHYTLTRKCR